MESSAATLRSRVVVLPSSERVAPVLTWALGFSAVALVAGSDGGYRATTWAWTALVTWWLAVLALIVKRRFAVGPLAVTMIGGAIAFAGWFAISATWSLSAPSTLDETIRYVAYAGLLTAGLLLVERRRAAPLAGGVTAAIAVLALFGLGTRVLPDRLGAFDSSEADYRLSTPITYWNGLGLFCVIGLILAAGFAARGRHLGTRAAAGAALPVLAVTMYFTFSRGAWLALAAGLVAAAVVDPRRLQLTVAVVVVGAAPALAVVLASGAGALTTPRSPFRLAVEDGHSLVPSLLALVVVSAGVAVLLGALERRVHVPRTLRRAWAGTLVVALGLCIAGTWATAGSPVHLTERAWEKAHEPAKIVSGDAQGRLFDLSSNGRFDLWHAAWDSFTARPLHGSGGGTYWELWAASPHQSLSSTEAHSVYLETLAELGVVGLALLLVLLVPPLVAGARARRVQPMPFVLGAYVAWLVHSGFDWDWELVGVSSAALLCGVALVAAARGREAAATPTPWTRAVATAVAAVAALLAVTSVVANTRLDAGNDALTAGRDARAVTEARGARRFAPWSTRALEVIAAARTEQSRSADALAAYRQIVERDPNSWVAWAELAVASSGEEHRHAAAMAHRLNTRAPQL